MRKTLFTGLVAAALMGMGLGFASPAQAAGTLTDNGDDTFTVASVPFGGSEQVVICSSSVSVNLCNNAAFMTDALYVTDTNGIYGVGSLVRPSSGPSVGLPAGTYTIVLRTIPPSTAIASLVNFAIGGGGGGGSSASGETRVGPADEIQQVGQPAAGCENLSLPSLDWAGVSSGGWSPSWAEWVNGGRGGPVCTRTLAYSLNTNTWFVRP